MLPELINSKLIDLHGQEGHSTRHTLEHLVSLVAESWKLVSAIPFIPLSRQDLTAASWETVVLIPLYPMAEASCITRLVKAVANPSLDSSGTQVKNFIMKTLSVCSSWKILLPPRLSIWSLMAITGVSGIELRPLLRPGACKYSNIHMLYWNRSKIWEQRIILIQPRAYLIIWKFLHWLVHQ